MQYIYRLTLCILLLVGSFAGYGQTPEPVVSGSFQSLSLEQFARQLEAQTRYRFFFDTTATGPGRITLQVQKQALSTVLAQALGATELRFAIDAEEHTVFITPRLPVATELPAGYFRAGPAVVVAEEQKPAETAPVRAADAARLYEIGRPGAGSAAGKATLAGHIREARSGEPVPGAAVYVEAPAVGATTDQFGYYALTLPPGRYTLNIRGLGIKNTRRQVQLNASGKLDVEVDEDITNLKEVVIEAEKDKNVAGMQMGLEKLDIRTIRQVPTAFGETDILRVVLTLPGVKSVGEGSTGLSVRGGGTDQNLILFNDATVYNPSHLFGFFSAFNPDILKSVELYKSAIPARFGGRLSSVLDIATRDGNKKKLSGSGGIGALTSRLTLEGPIIKDKSSFLVGARTSYSDWILHLLPNQDLKESAASFYDLSAHLSHELNANNTLYATGYFSQDRFRLAADTSYAYQNRSGSLKWKHLFGNKLYGVLTTTYTQYQYQISSRKNPVNASELTFGIRQLGAQADFSYFPSAKHTVDFGASTLRYRVDAGKLVPSGAESLIRPDELDREQAQETALYVSDKIEITPRLALELGLRYSFYQALGPRAVSQYAPGLPRTTANITDTVRYGAGAAMATYHGPEYRASLKYALSDNSSVKASYNRTRQYISQLSNTTSLSPTDTWKLSDAYVRPQVGDQVALGYYRNFRRNTIETSVEGYYKRMHDFVDYKSGARLLLNHHLETDLINAEGKAYGVEFSIRKSTGKINGWLNYTYSRSLVRANAGTPAEQINGGAYYPSNIDKPHEVTLAGNYRFSRRFSTSLNFNYSTGRPITLPLARYYVDDVPRVLYSDRNAYRVPDYYRVDFAMNIEGGHKAKKLAHSSWTLAIYNLTGRHNPYSVYFKSVNGQIKGYQLSIFGRPIPTVTYNFKF
ncbi:TonB-dependent receptor [Hymenobacter chitinivorans]|uniref:Outer membrane receptor for ferrienterochelin and colicin n=1 Tax=Hymenobacter chitinivorans DSM 11115 TaxID=1121954 RepID=A0A2M9B503_9BACT|nr:TonB-dependent receptor [Hymenobacter chitinivorans]PJJ52985.1 outer membrane receptor for ferrienterochelin and colicin [Hymenobacter chitinivorans DSM 11115]